MTKADDPKRLVEERGTPAPLRDALRLARRGPDATSVSRMAGALGLAPPLAPPPVPPPSGLALATGGGSALGVAGITAIVVTGIGAGTLFFARPDPVPTPSVEPPVAVVASAAIERSPSSEEPAALVGEPERAVKPAPSVRRRKLEPEVSAPEPPPSAAAQPPSPESPPADAASRLREEALLVRSAERLLGSEPARALALTEERRRRFPGGALAQEAEVVAIEALLKLGRREDAAARAKTFEASHPGSVHARRLRALFGSKL